MPATKFICPKGKKIPITECLKGCPEKERCMFLPTLRAIAKTLNRNLKEPSVTELIAGVRETYLRKTTDYSKNLAREVRKGLKENALKCQHTGGLPPLGYNVDKASRQLVINPEEAAAV